MSDGCGGIEAVYSAGCGAEVVLLRQEMLQFRVEVTRNEQKIVGQGFVEPDFEIREREATSQLQSRAIRRVHSHLRKLPILLAGEFHRRKRFSDRISPNITLQGIVAPGYVRRNQPIERVNNPTFCDDATRLGKSPVLIDFDCHTVVSPMDRR